MFFSKQVMRKEDNIDIIKALNHYIANIVDGRIADYIKQNKHKLSHEKASLPFSQPINFVLPMGWNPEKFELLKVLHRFLFRYAIIVCTYKEFEHHFVGRSKDKVLWAGTQTELMFLISDLIYQLNLIPAPAKRNLNIIISEHFRNSEGDFDPQCLKVSNAKGVGNEDRLDIMNKIIAALRVNDQLTEKK